MKNKKIKKNNLNVDKYPITTTPKIHTNFHNGDIVKIKNSETIGVFLYYLPEGIAVDFSGVIDCSLKESDIELYTKEYKIEDKIIKFHDSCCDRSHSDQCTWLYEIKNGQHNWNGFSHMLWKELYIHAKRTNFVGYYKHNIQYEE